MPDIVYQSRYDLFIKKGSYFALPIYPKTRSPSGVISPFDLDGWSVEAAIKSSRDSTAAIVASFNVTLADVDAAGRPDDYEIEHSLEAYWRVLLELPYTLSLDTAISGLKGFWWNLVFIAPDTQRHRYAQGEVKFDPQVI